MIELRTIADDEMITEPGFYRLSARRYHRDPCATPSLSSSIAKIMLDASPRHAWTAHPRLNPEGIEESDPTRPKEIGNAAHEYLLGEGRGVVVIDEDTYKSKDAQTARANAYEKGLNPILRADMTDVEAMCEAAREQMRAQEVSYGITLLEEFEVGLSEVVMVWKDAAGPWCRAMCDKLLAEQHRALITDLKTSGTSVSPVGAALGWKVEGMGYEVSAAFYERGIAHLLPALEGRIEFRHLWLEMDAPYALIASELDGAGKDIGKRMAAAAIGLWHRCLSVGTKREAWPRYSGKIHRIEYPTRAESDWLAREMDDEQMIGEILGRDPFICRQGSRPRAIDQQVLDRGFA